MLSIKIARKSLPGKISVFLFMTILILSSCAKAGIPVTGEKVEPSRVEPVEGSDFSRVVLTDKAVQRLDIQTDVVDMKEIGGKQYKVVPYSAVMYGLDGDTWTYTNPEKRVYIRQAISIDHIDGDLALLVDGPEVGTPIVTVGAPLLYGAEVGVSK